MLADRKARIEQGLKDAEQARRDRENAEAERVATLAEARREANDILARAQKVAQETRDADIAATKEELERLRERATAEIEAEKVRAITDVRAEVADLALAAAGRVVGETMTERARAPARRGVPAAAPASGGSTELMARRDIRRAPLRRGRLRGRPARRHASTPGGPSSTRPPTIVGRRADRARARQPGDRRSSTRLATARGDLRPARRPPGRST